MKTTEEVAALDTDEFRQHLASLEPMKVAALLEDMTRAMESLEKEVSKFKTKIEKINELVLDLIIDEKLPGSFRRPSGANIHTQSQLWASAKGKDHARLSAVLEKLSIERPEFKGLLPKTVNSHSLSAYVREHLDEHGDIVVQSEDHPEGIPQELLECLNVNTKTSVKITGL